MSTIVSIRQFCVTLFVILLATAALAEGKEGLLLRAKKPNLKKIILLSPAADAEVKRNFAVLVWSDGQQSLVERPGPRDGSPRADRAIAWSVDLRKGTYTTKLVPLSERDRAQSERARERAGAQAALRRSSLSDDFGNNGYSYSFATETWEPGAYFGFQGLTRTEAEIDWSECGYAVYLDDFLPSCWANSQTFAYTTWYTRSCTANRPVGSSTNLLSGDVTGAYINWDFGDDNQATYVTERVHIDAYGGGYAYGWSNRTKAGEFNWLLSGQDFEGMVLTRPSRCSSPGGNNGGGGGSGPNPGDDNGGPNGDGTIGGGETCVEVDNGVTGELLGYCCGTTTTQIVDCAATYLN